MSYYENQWLRGRWASWQDARAGRQGQANARWGWIKAPGERGPILWMQSFTAADEQRLGVELARAIAEKRRDLRMVMTFEQEYPQMLQQHTEGIERLGYGFGPCDHPQAVERTLDKLSPLRYLALGRAPRQVLSAALERRKVPSILMAADPGNSRPTLLEAIYPRDSAQAELWQGKIAASLLQEPVDFATLFTIAQVDPNFRSMISGTEEGLLWWVQGLSGTQWQVWRQAWLASSLSRRGILFLGGQETPQDLPKLSRWQRQPLPAGSLLAVDEERWYPALAAAAQAVHLQSASSFLQWQVYAGSRPVSVHPGVIVNAISHLDAGAVEVLDQPAQVLQHWQDLSADVMTARQRGDATRRVFWQERRLAGERLPEFLQRVFDW
ncbi:hypothetical protein B1757_08245 [Acidithiobacillus marinus]|uniref:3-deoxy-D-manno-octulosonic-acid transferase N-terminal domain-containing protein n=1 Tax=Acidithiobacillus marinus TaxID=187490 RepID=A0A2I1DL22_9PROT|nr:hypothetical protein [Acidithiobacillus marinus]PKY10561.1 hypothetical protein B1757_08245 [Acidithiobacillus marinus]